jgi:hypothetical protein
MAVHNTMGWRDIMELESSKNHVVFGHVLFTVLTKLILFAAVIYSVIGSIHYLFMLLSIAA